MLDAEVAGERDYGRETRTSAGIVSLAIEDTTPKLVEAKPEEDIRAALTAAMAAAMGDHGLNPGEDFKLMGSDLFASDVAVLSSAVGRGAFCSRRVGRLPRLSAPVQFTSIGVTGNGHPLR